MVINCRCSRPVGCKQKSGSCNCSALPVLLKEEQAGGRSLGTAAQWLLLPTKAAVSPVPHSEWVWRRARRAVRVIFASVPSVYKSTRVAVSCWLILPPTTMQKAKRGASLALTSACILKAFLGFGGMDLGINYGTECQV